MLTPTRACGAGYGPDQPSWASVDRAQPRVGPEFDIVQLRAGDVLLLCSDGLTGPVTDEQILGLMLRYEDPMRCCRALTEAACAAGGPDNVTVAIARFSGEGLELPHGREEVAVQRVQLSI